MANQYSITVSDRADRVLKELKKKGYKTSQCISALIETMGFDATANMVVYQKRIAAMNEQLDEELA